MTAASELSAGSVLASASLRSRSVLRCKQHRSVVVYVDKIRLSVQPNPYYGRVFSWSLSPDAHVPAFGETSLTATTYGPLV